MLALFPLTLLLLGEAGADFERAEATLGDVDRSTESLMLIIESQRLSTADIHAIEEAIKLLGSDKFLDRERGTERLLAQGAKATGIVQRSLQQAMKQRRPEQAARLQAVVEQSDPAAELQRTWAAAVLLSDAEPSPGITLRLLQSLPVATWGVEMTMLNAAQHHLPAADARALESQNVNLPTPQAARHIFLSQLQPKHPRALPTSTLHPDHPRIQLAAARVMTTSAPTDAARRLVKLCEQEPRGIRDEAMYLLRAFYQQQTSRQAKRTWQADDWRKWLAARKAPLQPLTAEIAFRWGKFAQGLREDFDQAQARIKDRYLTYRYEHTIAAEAAAKDGRLYLRGNHDEGDQRLIFTADQIAGAPTLTEPFTVETKLGGTPGNAVGWHVGVSIGQAKILFHPDYTNGAFRIEHCDSHEPFVNNENMTFTPASNALYKMSIVARPQKSGGVDLTVTIHDPTSLDRFHTGAKLTAQQVGPIRRVALERSGRTGGDAMFDYIDIRLGVDE